MLHIDHMQHEKDEYHFETWNQKEPYPQNHGVEEEWQYKFKIQEIRQFIVYRQCDKCEEKDGYQTELDNRIIQFVVWHNRCAFGRREVFIDCAEAKKGAFAGRCCVYSGHYQCIGQKTQLIGTIV